MGIRDIIEGKKQWRAHVARVETLPPDYQIGREVTTLVAVITSTAGKRIGVL